MRTMIIATLLLAGCATVPGAQNMSADQLKALALDKNTAAICATATGTGGSGHFVYVNADLANKVGSTVTVTPDCAVSTTSSPTPAAPKP